MKHPILRLLFICLLGCIAMPASAQKQDYQIYLKSGTIPAPATEGLEKFDKQDFQVNFYNNHYYLILQFAEIPTEAEKRAIEAAGIRLLNYLPSNSWIARLPENFDYKGLQQLNVIRVLNIEAQHKYDNFLSNNNIPAHATVGGNLVLINVVGYSTVEKQELSRYLSFAGFDLIDRPDYPLETAVRIDINRIADLARLAPVMYVEPVEAPAIHEGLLGRTSHRANLLSSQPGTGFDGTGVVMGIADDGGLSHIDFQGRLTDHNATQGGTHGDMVSGIAAGAGNVDPTKLGMATGSYLHSYGISGYPHITNALTNYTNLGTVVTSTSYSQGCGGVYDNTAVNIDQDNITEPELLHVFSAGNSSSSTCSGVYGSLIASDGRRYGNITGGRKAAKNTIATANLEYDDDRTASSSRGPCEDGRIKPDIAAHGTGQQTTAPNNTYQAGGGTSAASPGICGVSAMLYSAYKNYNNNQTPRGSLIKGIMMNTADDLGRSGPDYDFGWGRVNTNRALDVIATNKYVISSVSQNGLNTHTINVPANVSQVKIMVNWLDPAGTTTAAKALVNDLDMTVTTPGNTTLLPWRLSTFAHIDSIQRPAFRGTDRLNNVEQVTIDNPTAGNHTVRIRGFAVPSGPQTYQLNYTFIMNEIKVTYPNGEEHFVPGSRETIRWDAFGSTGNFTVQYSSDNGSSWNTLSTNVNGSRRHLDWTPPGSVSDDMLVRVTRGGLSDVSDSTFNLIGVPSNLNLTYVNDSTATMTWNGVTGATSYDVFNLGTQYMQVIGNSTTTSFTVTGLSLGNVNWYSVRARNNSQGIIGRRAIAIEYSHGGNFGTCLNCSTAINSFPYTQGFETGIGNWCQENNDDLDWTRDQAGTPSSGTGPSAANTGSWYMYTEASGNGTGYPNKEASFVSPCFDLRGTSKPTFVFWYNMYGSAMGTLNVEVSTDGGFTWPNLAYTRAGNQGTAWQTDTIDLSSYKAAQVKIRFRGVTGSSFTSDMAIDDIELYDDQQLTCTTPITTFPYSEGFETNFGIWNQSIGDDIDWTRRSGSTPSPSTGPTAAHGGTFYAYTEASAPNYPNRVADLFSNCFDLTSLNKPQLNFWYHMYGAAMGTLEIEVTTDLGGTWNTVWTKSGDQGNLWHEAGVDLSSYSSNQTIIRFHGTTGTNFTSDISIDDIELYDASDCKATISSYPYIESFEQGIGAWTQDQMDDLDWTRLSGQTGSVNTGPTSAFDGSFYMYTEASGTNYPFKQTRFLSPCFNLSNIARPEFTFSYHMYGAAMGTMSVDITTNGGTTWTSLWSSTGNLGNEWFQEALNLEAYSGQIVQLRFNGITGNSFASDMAIDYVTLEPKEGDCAASVVSFPYQENFDNMAFCGVNAFNCIEDGTCPLSNGWQNATGDDIDFSVNGGGTASANTGPNGDHTSGTGRYLFTEASGCATQTAYLVSPCFKLSSTRTTELVFWYHMNGSDMGSLSVQASTNQGQTWSGNLWNRSGNQSTAWQKAAVSLTAYNNTELMLRFTAVTGQGYTSDIALDDISIANQGVFKSVKPGVAAQGIQAESFQLSLYPNPAQDLVNLEYNLLESNATISVVDLFGKVLRQEVLTSGSMGHQLNVSDLPAGSYFLRMQQAGAIKTLRFVVAR